MNTPNPNRNSPSTKPIKKFKTGPVLINDRPSRGQCPYVFADRERNKNY